MEDYEKKYKEALTKSKEFYEMCKKCGAKITEDFLKNAFPELAESEDERIRKDCISIINAWADACRVEGDCCEVAPICIAWLEKQSGKDKLIKELGEYKYKYTLEVLEKYINSMNNKDEERLRKTTIAFLKDFAEQGYENAVECIDWLEKQGEQKPTSDTRYEVKDSDNLSVNGQPFDYEHATITQKDFASVGETATIELSSPIDCGDRIYHVSHKPIEKQGEQKHINDTDEEIVNAVKDTSVLDMVEPKFKVGDWITDGEATWKIGYIDDDMYIEHRGTISGGGAIESIDKHYHLWTIQDAKEGDVLCLDDSKCIALFKNIYDKESFNSYGFVGHCTGTFESGLSYHAIEGAHPATYEQRDLLFKKMKEEGYEWDDEKKELKKIEPQPSTWSEEDKDMVRYIGNAITCKESAKYLEEKGIDMIKAHIWLDSFKPQPKQEWSDEDERMYRMCVDAVEYYHTPEDESTIRNWLKSLKERNAWKPSKGQMHAFEQVYEWYNDNFAPSETLTSLYNDLKKL